MSEKCKKEKFLCQYYIPNYNIGFKIVTPSKGEVYVGTKKTHNSMVFMLDGEVEFSYNEFLNRNFKKGDLFFVPQSAEMFGKALTKSKMLVLTFNNRVESLCDNCCLSDYSSHKLDVDYDFKPLKLTPSILKFANIMEYYIDTELRCSFMHELKQKELFILMSNSYSPNELIEFFYPIVGSNPDFKSTIFEMYSEGLSVQQFAQKFGMSYTGFLRKFKAEFGEPVQDWMLKQKAKHIKLKLSIPGTTISDIVNQFQFTDASHFTKYCHKYFGCTLSALIKQIRSL